MTQRQEEILDILNLAIEQFNLHERFLIENDLSERCICSKFASYLEDQLRSSTFIGYDVDVEYNRGMRGSDYEAKENPETKKKIVIDLVVHKRECDYFRGYDNLFCIEMKKGRRESDLLSDKKRLKMMVDINKGFCYQAGYMIVIISDKKSGFYRLEVESSYYL